MYVPLKLRINGVNIVTLANIIFNLENDTDFYDLVTLAVRTGGEKLSHPSQWKMVTKFFEYGPSWLSVVHDVSTIELELRSGYASMKFFAKAIGKLPMHYTCTYELLPETEDSVLYKFEAEITTGSKIFDLIIGFKPITWIIRKKFRADLIKSYAKLCDIHGWELSVNG